jgi:hypothetical protein
VPFRRIAKRAFAVLIFFGKKNDADAIQAVFDLAIQDRNELALETMRHLRFPIPDPEQNSAKYWILNNREGLKKIDPELRFLDQILSAVIYRDPKQAASYRKSHSAQLDDHRSLFSIDIKRSARHATNHEKLWIFLRSRKTAVC